MAMDKSDVARKRQISVEQVELLQESRGLTQEGIEEMPESSLKRAIRRLDFPDAPRARLAYRLAQARDDSGRLPVQPLASALRELDSLRLRAAEHRVAGIPTGGVVTPASLAPVQARALPRVPPPLAGLEKRTWVALGPGNIGGRTRAILPHPTDAQTIWVGSVGGGIWRTEDGGAIWAPVDDFMANLAVTSLVMDPRDAKVIYAGTGEGFGNVDSIRGAGIFVTTDGAKWQQLSSTSGANWTTVNRLAISADGAVLLAATNTGLRRSDDSSRSTWQTVLPNAVADVKFHPTDPKRAVAGSLSTGASWFTTDGGATWTPSTHTGNWGRRVEVCYARANPNIVYASVDAAQGQIWRSSDGGHAFVARKTKNKQGDPANYLGDQGWYGNVIWAGDPTTADLVIVGGVDLFRSTDGGDTLTDISTWWDPRSAHADHHAIVAHPSYDGAHNRTVYFGNDGGIYRADDVTKVGNETKPPKVSGWKELNNSYGVTQFYGVAGNVTSGRIIAGAQDNGTIAYDAAAGAENWKQIFGGDGGFCAADPNDPKVFYGEYVFLNIHRNTDGATTDDEAGDRYITGQFWNEAAGDWAFKPVPFQIPDASNQRALFIAPFALDPNEANRMLAGGESLWRSDDVKAPNSPTSGPKWLRIKTPSNGFISTIGITPGNSDRVWVGYDNGEVWRSLNATSATPTWSQINSHGPNALVPKRYCNQVYVSPHDADTVFAVFGGFVTGNVWRSDDGGATWRNLGGALPAAPVRAVTVHPGHANFVYVGTEVGVFASEDGGATWSPTNEGPANVAIDNFFWMADRLLCATHGRGVFAIDLKGL